MENYEILGETPGIGSFGKVKLSEQDYNPCSASTRRIGQLNLTVYAPTAQPCWEALISVINLPDFFFSFEGILSN